ncbi:PucR family transcriptional regulator, partial [Streptomyces sp. PGLac3x]
PAARAHADGRTAPHGAPATPPAAPHAATRPVDALRPVTGERALAAPVHPGEPPAGPLTALAEHVEAAAARAGEALLVVPDGERLVLLTADGGAAARACVAYAAALAEARTTTPAPAGGTDAPGMGLSAPAGPLAAASAYRPAEPARSGARRRGRARVEHEEVATGAGVQLLSDDAVRAFAAGLLRALREHDATGRGDLVASLRAWLSRHGQWDAAAAELGVHRHTLRYRMRRVEEILGRSLDAPDVRMELWLALKATSGTE